MYIILERVFTTSYQGRTEYIPEAYEPCCDTHLLSDRIFTDKLSAKQFVCECFKGLTDKIHWLDNCGIAIVYTLNAWEDGNEWGYTSEEHHIRLIELELA